MRVYRMSYTETMALPMRVFWHLWGSIERLLAHERKDHLEDMAQLQCGGDTAAQRLEALDKAAPSALKLTGQGHVAMSSERDANAGDVLRSLM